MILSKTDREVQQRVLSKVIAERDRQDHKWPDEDLFADPHHWLRILVEEVGEVSAEISHDHFTSSDLEEELVQVAAVAIGWLEDIEHEKGRVSDYAKLWNDREGEETKQVSEV